MALELTGAAQVKARLTDFKLKEWPEKKQKALAHVSYKILAKAQEYVPKDSMDLHDSGRVVESEKGHSMAVVFGDEYTEAYALAVHEHLSEHSPPSWIAAEASGHGINWSEPGTGPGFLTRAILEEAGEYLQDLHSELKLP